MTEPNNGGPSNAPTNPSPTSAGPQVQPAQTGAFRMKTTASNTAQQTTTTANVDLNYFRPGGLSSAEEVQQVYRPRTTGPAGGTAAASGQGAPFSFEEPSYAGNKRRYRPENDDNLFRLPPDPNQPGSSSTANGTFNKPSSNFGSGNRNGYGNRGGPAGPGPQQNQQQANPEPALELPKAPSTNTVLVSTTQRGNPVLDHIRNVPWEFHPGLAPDYQVGRTSCALFLSLKYHRLHPEYITGRLGKLGRMYALRVLLVLVDVDDHEKHLREVHSLCLANGVTVVLAWSNEEAGRYLETFKAYENKPPDAIKAKVEDGYLARLTNFLTSVKGVNKTDVVNLASGVGPLAKIIQASQQDLVAIPGFGETKATKLHAAFRTPFKIDHAARDKEKARKEAREHAMLGLTGRGSGSDAASGSAGRAMNGKTGRAHDDDEDEDDERQVAGRADDDAVDDQAEDGDKEGDVVPAGGLAREESDDDLEDAFSDGE